MEHLFTKPCFTLLSIYFSVPYSSMFSYISMFLSEPQPLQEVWLPKISPVDHWRAVFFLVKAQQHRIF